MFVLLSLHSLINVHPVLAASDTVTAISNYNFECCIYRCDLISANVTQDSNLSGEKISKGPPK